jgi:hypothetical protein
MAKTRRARIDAENDHRRVTRPRLRIFVKETRGYPTGYLRASSDTIQHGPESREVGYDEAIIPSGLWLNSKLKYNENVGKRHGTDTRAVFRSWIVPRAPDPAPAQLCFLPN